MPGPSEPWRPTATGDALAARARLLARVRAYFAQEGVMEVETPILSRAATTDPALASLATACDLGGEVRRLYLHTSPELPMKRLLAAGSGPIYQICKVFRDGERGRLHHPEFTMLEWYRPGWDYRRLMGEVANLARFALERGDLLDEAIPYAELFVTRLGVDPLTCGTPDLRALAVDRGIAGAEQLALGHDGWLDLLLTHLIEPELGRGRLTFVYDYPPSQAALARVRGGATPVAERFELYLEGMELANGFQELTDPLEQRRRLCGDLARRRAAGLPEPPADEAFLAALAAGMPETAGVALGIDRLLMAATGSARIDGVLAFAVERA